MAGDWIPMRVDLTDDPAVIAIASATGLDEFAVVGRLFCLWSWANRHLPSGHAPCVTELWIDRYTAAPGFAAAMLNAGWLLARSGGVEFPNFDRWNSQGAKRRLLASQRKAKERSRGECDKNATKEEKRRGKKRKTPLTPQGGEGKTLQPRNLLFDAVAEVSGMDPATAGGRIGTAQALMAKAEPPYSPDEVREFGRQFWQLCPWAAEKNRTRPTPHEIATHIGLLRAGPGNVQGAAGRHNAATDYARATLLDALEAK